MADPEALRKILHSPTPFSTWVGIVLLFALFGVIVLAVVGPSPRRSDYEETRAKKRMENLKTARDDAEKALNTYAWVDKNKGVAHIPINRAMELTIAELAQKKPAAAGPIATPAAPAAPASPTASPAPGGSPKTVGAQPSPRAGGPAASPAPQAAASSSPAAQQSSPAPASPTPAKSP
jgi:hypothetical protein